MALDRPADGHSTDAEKPSDHLHAAGARTIDLGHRLIAVELYRQRSPTTALKGRDAGVSEPPATIDLDRSVSACAPQTAPSPGISGP